MFWKTPEGTTGRLIQLCIGYFFFYIITGVTVKYFTGPAEAGFPALHDLEFLVYSTVGGNGICMAWVVATRAYRLKSAGSTTVGGISFPAEYLYIIPSGICTAWIIVSTTLNYMLLPSVMVAMVITRGSVIVVSRLVDAAQIRQGILKKKVYWQEEAAVVVAIFAVATQVLCHFEAPPAEGASILVQPAKSLWIGWIGEGSASRWSTAAMLVLVTYVIAYAIRIYLMNYFKNTRGKGVPQDNTGFFAIEQVAASIAIASVAAAFYFAAPAPSAVPAAIDIYRGAFGAPRGWFLTGQAILAGMAYGGVAFFSVFIFMFKGRTATFAGLVNRLTSLMAGTVATLSLYAFFNPIDHVTGERTVLFKLPKAEDWASLLFILVAVAFLTLSERRRTRELAGPQGG